MTATTGTTARGDLDALLSRYLDARGLVNADVIDIEDQAKYVVAEALELYEAVLSGFPSAAVRLEIADVALAVALCARVAWTTVEECIAEKTEADRGRG